MANILSAENLSKAFGPNPLFEHATLGIEERDRIALIGPNGCGKSTLLKALAGLEPVDDGRIARRQGLRVHYLAQDPPYQPDESLIAHVFHSDVRLAALVRDYELTMDRIAHAPGDSALLRRYDALTREMETSGAWEYEARAKAVLHRLGLTEFAAPMGTLSGGQRKRAALARALLAEPELLLLDEPTNHLDADTVAWLEEYLARFSGALVVVTHDRYFLDRVTQRIIEIDRGAVRTYDGNYAFYLERKSELEADFAKKEDRRRNQLRRELEWLRRGPKARTSKAKSRIDNALELQETSFARTSEAVTFVSGTRRLGRKVAELRGVRKVYDGRAVIDGVDYTFARGERLGLIGPNGCGKSTLAALIAGRITPDGGEVDVGETVRFSIYDQDAEGLDPDERAIDYIRREGGPVLRAPDGQELPAAQMLERFLFTPQMQYAPCGRLSGGERRRLYLVRTLMRDPNFLILDEPTNDLDIGVLRSLEDYLEGFQGCLLVVSHDRYFLDRTVDKLLAWEPGGWRLWPGPYSVYARMRAEDGEADTPGRASGAARPAKAGAKADGDAARGAGGSSSRRLSYKEKRELETLEARIPELEAELKRLDGAIADAAADYAKLAELTARQAALHEQLDLAIERWTELAE